MTDRVKDLIDRYDPGIREDQHGVFDELLSEIRYTIDQLTPSEIVRVQCAIRTYGEMDITLSGNAVVNYADSMTHSDYLLEGDEFFLGRILWRVITLSDLGLCDVNQVVDFFSNFRAWLTRLPKHHRRVVDQLLIEEQLEAELARF